MFRELTGVLKMPTKVFLGLLIFGFSPLTFGLTSAPADICENSLRMKLENKAIELHDEIRAQDLITQANTWMKKLKKIEYSVVRSNDRTSDLIVVHSLKSPSRFMQMTYDLSKDTHSEKGGLLLTIAFTAIGNGVSADLKQSFSVADDCKPKLLKTESVFLSMSSQKLRYQSKTYYLDGSADLQEKLFELPSAGRLLNLTADNEDPRRFRANDLIFLPEAGILRLKISDPIKKSVVDFDEKFQLSVKHLVARRKNVDVIDILIGMGSIEKNRSDVPPFKFVMAEMGSGRTWIVPHVLWSAEKLSNKSTGFSTIDFQLPKDYLSENSTFRIVATEKPSYENIAGYLTVQSSSQSSSTSLSKAKSFLVEEKYPPVFTDRARPEDLSSTTTLQTSLPQIKAIADSIRLQVPSERRGQIELILKYLCENYPYDVGMRDNAAIRPMTVKDALARGKGVCQQFAVIFATLARALGIPARIIMGYNLEGGTSTLHVWNEVEVWPNTWQVVEPQLKNGLTDTRTRFYFPMTRARMLEDLDLSGAEMITALSKGPYKLIP